MIRLIAARPLIGQSDQAFRFIPEFSGVFTPGITVIFLLGLSWQRASGAGAIAAALAVAASLLRLAGAEANRFRTDDVPFGTTVSFNIGAVGVVLILVALYATWW